MMALMLCEEYLHILLGWEEEFLLPWVEERALQTAEPPHPGSRCGRGSP